jgi:hypothetical protein
MPFLRTLAFGTLIVLGITARGIAQTADAGDPAAVKKADDHNFTVRIGSDNELTPDVLKRLSPEQIENIVKSRENHKSHTLDPEIIRKLTPEQLQAVLVAREEHTDRLESFGVPTVFFLFLATVIGLRLFVGYRKDKQRYETLRFMVEKGAQIPVEMIQPPMPRPPNDLRRGILLVTMGLGLSTFLAIAKVEDRAWAAGLIPLLLGVGYLLAWKLEQKPAPRLS